MLRLIRDIVPRLVIEVVLAVLYLFEKLKIVLIIKRWRARQKYVGDDADAPIVTLHTVRLLLKDLWSDVPWRTASGARKLILIEAPG